MLKQYANIINESERPSNINDIDIGGHGVGRKTFAKSMACLSHATLKGEEKIINTFCIHYIEQNIERDTKILQFYVSNVRFSLVALILGTSGKEIHKPVLKCFPSLQISMTKKDWKS